MTEVHSTALPGGCSQRHRPATQDGRKALCVCATRGWRAPKWAQKALQPPRGQLPLWHLRGLPHRHSAPALLSEEALPADTNQFTLSTSEDGVKSIPTAEMPSLRKKKGKNPRRKQADICQTSNFQLDFQKHFRLLKPREERKQNPSSSTSIESTQMKCKIPI